MNGERIQLQRLKGSESIGAGVAHYGTGATKRRKGKGEGGAELLSIERTPPVKVDSSYAKRNITLSEKR